MKTYNKHVENEFRYMKILQFVIILPAAIILFGGCKSPSVISDPVDEDTIEESIFSARQDTVKIQTYPEALSENDRQGEATTEYYTVQIGAYVHAMNAERVYREAQQRFNLETNTSYDATEELYKITVGKFTNYEQARAFCDRIMREFSTDYKDAWVVEITQRQRRKIQ